MAGYRVYTKYERSYFEGLEKVKPRPKFAGDTNFCPRCGGILVRDLSDLSCFWCGWRECAFFEDGGIDDEALIRVLLQNNVKVLDIKPKSHLALRKFKKINPPKVLTLLPLMGIIKVWLSRNKNAYDVATNGIPGHQNYLRSAQGVITLTGISQNGRALKNKLTGCDSTQPAKEKTMVAHRIPPKSSLPNTIDLVHTYLVNCERRGLSPATLRWYGFFLRNFARQHKELPLKPEPIEEFIYSHKTGDERRYGAFRCLRAFYNFIESRIFIEQKLDLINPFSKILPPRRQPKEKESLTLEELRWLLEYPGHDPTTRTMLYLLADTGTRIGEASTLTSNNIFSDSIKVKGKTGERIIPISSKVRAMLLELGIGKLFPHTPHWWSLQVSRAFKEAGLPGSAHQLRHTFCTLYEGTDQSLMTITGHKSFQVLQQYSHKKVEKAIKQHSEHGPLARLYGTNNSHGELSTAVDNSTIQTIVELARELGEAKANSKQLEVQLKPKLEYTPAASDKHLDLDGDLLNFMTNIGTIDNEWAICLAEAKFLYHAAMHNVCMSLANRQNRITERGQEHAIRYLVEHGYLHGRKGPGSRTEIKEILEREADKIIDILHQIFYCTGQHHYSLASYYGKLCAIEAQPGDFKIFDDLEL